MFLNVKGEHHENERHGKDKRQIEAHLQTN